jgi:hypothetical protein
MENRIFQYLVGPRAGEILFFDKVEQDDGIVFVCFKDGSRCNEELILPLNETAWEGKLMAEVSDTKNIWHIKEEWVGRQEEVWDVTKDGEKVCVQPFLEGRRKINAIPPRKTTAKFGAITSVIETPTQILANKNQNDPVWVMMDKAKKFDTPIPMELTISLPTKSLYNVAKESFDEGGEKVIEYIISNIDDKKLKDSLKIALLAAYEDVQEPIKKQIVAPGTSTYEPEVIDEPVIGPAKIENNGKLNG